MTMQYVPFGNTGMKVSRLCLGTLTFGSPQWRDWVMDAADSRPIVKAALDAGINFIDTADMYSLGASEEVVGKILAEIGPPRDELVVATKVYNRMKDDPNARGLSRKHIMESIDASLQRLGMDYVDLYQIHRWDYETPIEETLDALNDVVRAGKALYIGASSMWAWQFMKALSISRRNGWAPFVSMQPHYNLIYREEEREMLPLCRSEGIAVIPWSPLARGFLAGNRHRRGGGDTARARNDPMARRDYYGDQDFQIADKVVEIARERGVAPTQVALAWHLSKPHVTAPIVGVSKVEHVLSHVAALEITLTDDEIAALEAPYRPKPVAGHE